MDVDLKRLCLMKFYNNNNNNNNNNDDNNNGNYDLYFMRVTQSKIQDLTFAVALG